MKLSSKIRITYLTIAYFVQQNFTDWEGAKRYAEFICRDGWVK